jgi:hypothetical protein
VNLFPKCLIFFLKLLVLLVLIDAPAGADTAPRVKPQYLKKRLRTRGPMSQASIPVKLVWQIIRSQGQSSKMSTIAESFAAEGSLEPKTVDAWVLNIMGSEIPATVMPERPGVDGAIFTERYALLRALGAQPLAHEANGGMENADSLAGDQLDNEGVKIVLARSPHRSMETIYRSPEDDLYLVKLSLFVISSPPP